MQTLDEILVSSIEKRASDVHFVPGSAVMFRVDGILVASSDYITTPENIERLIEQMDLQESDKAELEREGEVDCAYSVPEKGRFRVNIYRQRGSYAMALRILAVNIPEPETLGLPSSVIQLSDKQKGLILVTGATGSGKSTTIASLIKMISQKYYKNIITLEDPIEYLHSHSRSIVSQREMGNDSQSYANALRAALRQDPDVILVGEMRDLETISIAITAAETGHLVFSTLHTNTAASTIDRIIDVFPAHQQQQIRIQLANVLEGVISQQLLPHKSGKGRVGAFEVLLKNAAVQNLIREAKAFQIPSVIQTNKQMGMYLMDDSLYQLYLENKISESDAIAFAHDRQALKRKVGIQF
ncbi:type IV pilus twitching motility protein PilT [Anaerosacchariphilus polymeriproducens]|uniref:Type IV pilus twitching motility protein PilT n=1 Tax=Anaerosacchariphilus polymeriproducens TaxID=1812858 RepID=A0A371AQP6_9FIRM|nr:type IV pilus twitching motility protein PilT [Anaerosacchariphilus polymeriproducens]RDU21852.1 type IV pilus twitching motility protein PilT [Anaerosacchariphilus polymeriproducens]